MKLFGFEITRKALNAVSPRNIWSRIIEPFTGAWQRNQEEKTGDVLCYPTLYACITLVAQDIAKLPFTLMKKTGKVWIETESSAYSPVLKKPNSYQTAQQFRESWILSKLQHGNTYVLKGRDNRGVVVAMYVLDACRVRPLVSDSGSVYYELFSNGWCNLPPMPAGIAERDGNIIVPASEIIHDRYATFHHELIGVPPLCAAHFPTVKNLKILKNATEFFGNGANPGGILTAPAGLSEEDSKQLKDYWDENFAGDNAGKVAVIGADMKFTSFAFKAADSQLVEQMKYSDEQIAYAFKVKPYKVGIQAPPGGWKSDDINVEYHDSALSPLIEAMEDLLVEGLRIQSPLRVQLDAAPLWRMDQGKQADVATKLVSGKISTPDEARERFNLASTGGGDTLWGQHQDYPLGVLADRNDLSPVEPEPDPEPDDTERALLALWKKSPESYANV